MYKRQIIQHEFFKKSYFDDIDYLKNKNDRPIIQAIHHDLSPYIDYLNGSPKIAITFADRKIPQDLVNKSKHFDFIVAGSTWCKNILSDHGVDSIVIHQGIDPLIFNSNRSEKNVFHDDFLIFSGGKFEIRKGQDITIKAYKVMQDKYPDVKLVCNWPNAYTGTNGKEELEKAGIDINRVIFVELFNNTYMAEIYQNTDIGIFPSRCEAGTNLVMMEYMACGKPAIATIKTGQSDLINSSNGLPLNSIGDYLLKDENGKTISIWEEPDVDHLVSLLEWSYNNRSKIKKIGKEASKTMSKKTWSHMAESVLGLI